MGQYFKWCIKLNDTYYQFIEIYWLESGMKLSEIAHLDNIYMLRLEKLISKGNLWYKQKLILAGDYTTYIEPYEYNLFTLSENTTISRNSIDITTEYIHQDKNILKENYMVKINEFQYICNHDTKEYIDKKKLIRYIHPLAILCNECVDVDVGDGSSGKWCCNRISVENIIPDDFTEYIFFE